jgi:hypothetical protein
MLRHGTQRRGQMVTGAKLTSQDVLTLRRLKGSARHRDLAARFGISQAYVSRILTRKSWAWLSEK